MLYDLMHISHLYANMSCMLEGMCEKGSVYTSFNIQRKLTGSNELDTPNTWIESYAASLLLYVYFSS